MRRIARFLSRPFADHRLLLQSVVALAAIKLGLSVLRFETVRRTIDRLSKVEARKNEPQWRLIRKVIWSVNVVSTYLPLFRNCLNRALATQLLLGRRGQPADVRIGVGYDPKGVFKAHAWIESEGRIVLGQVEDLPELTPLPPLRLGNIRS